MGGLRKEELTMIASGSGFGKSTLVTNLAYYMVKELGLSIVDIKLEESQRKSIYRYLAMFTGHKPRELRENPQLATHSERCEFIKSCANIFIHDHFGSLESTKLLSTLDYYASVECVDFIFLDHISIAVSGLESSREGERKDIDRLVTKLRELIQRTGVGIVCVSHLKNPPNDQPQWEEGRPVRRLDLRGSGALAQVSDNIIVIEGNLVDVEKKNDRVLKLIKGREADEQEVYCDTICYDANSGLYMLKKDVL